MNILFRWRMQTEYIYLPSSLPMLSICFQVESGDYGKNHTDWSLQGKPMWSNHVHRAFMITYCYFLRSTHYFVMWPVFLNGNKIDVSIPIFKFFKLVFAFFQRYWILFCLLLKYKMVHEICTCFHAIKLPIIFKLENPSRNHHFLETFINHTIK